MRIIQKVNIVLKTVATIAIMRFERENILDLSRLFTIVTNDKMKFDNLFHEVLNQFYCVLIFLSLKKSLHHLRNYIGNWGFVIIW